MLVYLRLPIGSIGVAMWLCTYAFFKLNPSNRNYQEFFPPDSLKSLLRPYWARGISIASIGWEPVSPMSCFEPTTHWGWRGWLKSYGTMGG